MKKIIFSSIAAFAVIISGCSTKSTSVSSDTSVDSNKGSSGRDNWDIDSRISQLNDTLNKVYFDFDKFNIRPDMQNVINNNANIFNTEVSGANITVEGNCDEWGTDEYNQALGLKRAKAVKEALVAQGVNSDRISIKSYGETNPVCTEKTKACDAQNRRAEFKLSK
ncbi:peptidoglycan-associated lipoprotein Pal [Campylobacter sp. LH-2024]|uniref:Peptidoglycan-associated lipoprotein Pal n=1 Tax=Campylobacter molothri TaxID=1032242 RepID=A0ACC5W188_9BACT|nr:MULTISPECIES: peptidoglycan-associated lipoprotein Pal [unclassified Campylobacter]MBZ7928497.1 peptidoglycan-associated lipoprotein Pal [Campylobacter sp. RM10542]MBZ7929920.1 peptidoglycan-associated lipoprotein Pal [Campylobacter sp. W0067]MBZ7931382.1 peptidoglycan-associated lipoprotein Pal [Campylobacter sp. RM12910]MBZ7932956.1 peptidoglycan-associated lipoprotein Pal [Campylobacter sp. RM10543]MBZ7934467.1 peptidoglycan-associated lipoprotein Pal [Campylobacter sp. W0065]MBZ7937424